MVWTVKRSENSIGETLVSVVDEIGVVICDNEPYYPQALDPQNADIIAASHDMLTALEEVKVYYCDNAKQRFPIHDQIEKAIRKAKGLPF